MNRLSQEVHLSKAIETQMPEKSNQIKSNYICTDDLPFSAFLKMKGFPLIKLDQNKSKITFTFETGDVAPTQLKVEFINSEFLTFYNELRNLKKLL